VPTDDRQILVVGQESAPAQFLVPGNGQIQPKCVRAVYDGSGAGSAFLPVLRFISDAGVTVGEFVGTEIAAGGSAAVSWFPGVGQSAAAATGSPPWCFLSRNASFVCAGTHNTVIVPDASSFYTNDASTYEVASDIFTGHVGPKILKDGHYIATVWAYPTLGFTAGEYGIVVVDPGGILNQEAYGFPFVVTSGSSNQQESTVTWQNLITVDSAEVSVPTNLMYWEIDNVAAAAQTMLLGAITIQQLDAVDQQLNP
jgi:hypothetical protein